MNRIEKHLNYMSKCTNLHIFFFVRLLTTLRIAFIRRRWEHINQIECNIAISSVKVDLVRRSEKNQTEQSSAIAKEGSLLTSRRNTFKNHNNYIVIFFSNQTQDARYLNLYGNRKTDEWKKEFEEKKNTKMLNGDTWNLGHSYQMSWQRKTHVFNHQWYSNEKSETPCFRQMYTVQCTTCYNIFTAKIHNFSILYNINYLLANKYIHTKGNNRQPQNS